MKVRIVLILGILLFTTNVIAGQTQHTVVGGDTLFKIAKAYLGDGFRYTELRRNGQLIEKPDRIYPGWVIEIPQNNVVKKVENNTPLQVSAVNKIIPYEDIDLNTKGWKVSRNDNFVWRYPGGSPFVEGGGKNGSEAFRFTTEATMAIMLNASGVNIRDALDIAARSRVANRPDSIFRGLICKNGDVFGINQAKGYRATFSIGGMAFGNNKIVLGNITPAVEWAENCQEIDISQVDHKGKTYFFAFPDVCQNPTLLIVEKLELLPHQKKDVDGGFNLIIHSTSF